MENSDFGVLADLLRPEDRRNAVNMGLLNAAGALLANQSPRLGPGLGAALIRGAGSYEDALQHAERSRIQQLGMAAKMLEAQRQEADRQKKLQALEAAKQQFPQLGALFDISPGEAVKRAFPETKYHNVGGALVPEPAAPGQQVSPVYTAPEKPTDLERMLDAAGITDPAQRQRIIMQGVTKSTTHAPAASVTVENYPNPIPVIDPVTGKTKMVRFGSKGGTTETPYQPAPPIEKPNDTERLAAGYGTRMLESEKIIQQIGEAGYPTEQTAVASRIPLVGAYAERRVMTPEQQQTRQAQEDWVRAKLRKESGAVINKDEMEKEISTYFPMPGDSQAVIGQKAGARAIAGQAMVDTAGPAWEKRTIVQKGWKDFGYASEAAAIKDAKNALMRDPSAKAEVIHRLEAMGIKNHGVK